MGQDDRIGLLGPPEAGRAGVDTTRWDELTEDVRPRDFTMAVALERIERLGDLFEPTLAGGQPLGAALRALRSSAA